MIVAVARHAARSSCCSSPTRSASTCATCPTVVLDADNHRASRAYVDAATQLRLLPTRWAPSADDAEIDQRLRPRPGARRHRDRAGLRRRDRRGRHGRGRRAGRRQRAQLGASWAARTRSRSTTLFGAHVLVGWADGARHVAVRPWARSSRGCAHWYNPERSSADFLIPGLMVVIIMIVTVQQTAVTLVRERESRHARADAAVSPIAPVGADRRQGAAVGDARLRRHGRHHGGLARGLRRAAAWRRRACWRSAMFLFVLCSLSIGLVISAVAPSIESANMVGAARLVPAGLHALGHGLPARLDPAGAAGRLVRCSPARYMVEISRGVFLRGTGWDVLWHRRSCGSPLYAVDRAHARDRCSTGGGRDRELASADD